MALSKENTDKLLEFTEQLNAKDRRLERTVDVVSIFSYLIGIRKSIFENPHEPPSMEWYEKLEKEKPARIVRNLCVIRNAIEHNFGKINDALRNSFRSIHDLDEFIPRESEEQLSKDGITVFKKSSSHLGQHIIEINRLLGDRINNCKTLFPTWLNWEYIRKLFIMPEGLTEEGIKAQAGEFYANKQYYPYQVYMNWSPRDCGNLLYSDKKFVTLLYEWNGDRFTQLNKVEDAGEYVTGSIYSFIEEGKKVIFFVDCENSDPYNLTAALESLDKEFSEKVDKVILFDDVHTSTAWEVLEKHISIPVERILIERIKENKSLVDIRLAMRISEEFYRNGADSFVLVSSDSDYWAVISSLPEAKFMVMVEHGKCGADIKNALEEKGIFYCYIDEFHSARSEGFMRDALYLQMLKYIEQNLSFNFAQMLDSAITAARVNMTPAEKKQYFDKHVRTFQASMDKEGELRISLKR